MEFKDRLLQERRRQGMNQETLADQINVSRQAVSKWETGEAMPDYGSLLALADALGVSLDYLCGRGEKQEAPAAPAAPEERPKPKRGRLLWIAAAGLVAIVAIVILLCVSYSGEKDSGTESNPAFIPDVVSVSGVELSASSSDGFFCRFTPSVMGEEYEWSVVLRDSAGNEWTIPAEQTGGSCTATGALGASGSGYTVIAVVSSGSQQRLLVLATDLHWDSNGSGHTAPV